MPIPSPSTYPKEKRWRFINRSLTTDDLITFSKNVVECHNEKIDNVLPKLLSFLPPGQRTKHEWLSIWINILHQMGLGYSWNQGKYIHSTELCNFLNQTNDVKSYYLYWALKFQFPFGFPKQKHYIDNDVSVQPIVLILQYLVQLYNLTNDVSKSYLTKNEITKFLMSSKNHEKVLPNSKTILSLRNKNYDYSKEESSNPGFLEAGNHFFSRGKLFLKNVELVKFSGNKIISKDKNHIQRIIKFLTFVNKPIVFKENTQDMRNNFFSLVYNNLDPYPQDLSTDIHAIKITTRVSPIPQGVSISRNVTNPRDTKGSFTKAIRSSRKFQERLRKDMLNLYKNKCCICKLDNTAFLRASHIVPVETDPSIAADRQNCILLCVIHDVAFEKGLIYLDDKHKIKINKNSVGAIQHPLLKLELIKRENQKISLPATLKPKIQYLKRHRALNGIL